MKLLFHTCVKAVWGIVTEGKSKRTLIPALKKQNMANRLEALYAKLCTLHVPSIDPTFGVTLDRYLLGGTYLELMKIICLKANLLFREV